MVNQSDFAIKTLGTTEISSPLSVGDQALKYVVDDEHRLLLDDRVSMAEPAVTREERTLLEIAGPRREIFFEPAKTRIGIVTCGGLCPGINDVIRGLVMESYHRYGVRQIIGLRNGYRGCVGRNEIDVVELTPECVSEIHELGGTILGTSRGPEESAEMVTNFERLGLDILFVIGGDGTMRGGLAIANEIHQRNLKISVVGLPKTIDNDIPAIDKSFGFDSAYSTAVEAIRSAHTEAHSTPNGVGIVKLMGRYSGFITCYASLATSHVNFALIPEVPFRLEGESGFLQALRDRLHRRHHAVVVVAEGAGQDLIETPSDEPSLRDASGNVKLKDIGGFLKQQIAKYFDQVGDEVTIKYIDPSYMIRSVPASASDSVFCWQLAQSAVHAAMAGKTEMVVGQWHGRMVHIPMQRTATGRKLVDPNGELWASVLESTGQPANLGCHRETER